MASPLAETHTTFHETTAPGVSLMKARVQSADSSLVSAPRNLDELDRLLSSTNPSECPKEAQRRRDLLLEHSPLKPAVRRISTQGHSPSQTFVKLMDEGVVQRLIGCERVLSEHLAQAVAQRRAGLVEESAALMGLVLRVSLAGGLESLIVRSSVQLGALLMQSPQCAAVSLSETRLETLRKAWRIWGTHSPAQDAQTQERLAHVLRRKVEETADEPTLDEVAVLERLLSQPGSASPGHLSRAVLRLMELYATAQLASPESSLRGMGLMVQWAKASALRATPPRDIDRALTLALIFEGRLRASGSSQCREMLADQLQRVLYHLCRSWQSCPDLAPVYLQVGRLLGEPLGAGLDTTALERVARLLGEGERLVRRDAALKSELRQRCMAIVGRWLLVDDPAAVQQAEALTESAVRAEPTVAEVVGQARLLMRMPAQDHQRLRNVHRARKLTERALASDCIEMTPRYAAEALLLKAQACMAARPAHRRHALHRVLGWLRRSVAMLTRQLKRQRTVGLQILLGRVLMTLSEAERQEALHWVGRTRTRLLEQALRDGRNAHRVFRAVGSRCQAAESLWILSLIHQAHLEGPGDKASRKLHADEGFGCAHQAMSLLQGDYTAGRYVGDHTQQVSLREHLRHDLIQWVVVRASAGQALEAISLDSPERQVLDGISRSAQSGGARLIESAPTISVHPSVFYQPQGAM